MAIEVTDVITTEKMTVAEVIKAIKTAGIKVEEHPNGQHLIGAGQCLLRICCCGGEPVEQTLQHVLRSCNEKLATPLRGLVAGIQKCPLAQVSEEVRVRICRIGINPEKVLLPVAEGHLKLQVVTDDITGAVHSRPGDLQGQ